MDGLAGIIHTPYLPLVVAKSHPPHCHLLTSSVGRRSKKLNPLRDRSSITTSCSWLLGARDRERWLASCCGPAAASSKKGGELLLWCHRAIIPLLACCRHCFQAARRRRAQTSVGAAWDGVWEIEEEGCMSEHSTGRAA